MQKQRKKENGNNVGRDENLIKFHLCHFCVEQKQCDFVWKAKFSQSYEEMIGIIK